MFGLRKLRERVSDLESDVRDLKRQLKAVSDRVPQVRVKGDGGATAPSSYGLGSTFWVTIPGGGTSDGRTNRPLTDVVQAMADALGVEATPSEPSKLVVTVPKAGRRK